MAYLARYVSRVAISNDRLMGIENDEVLFWYHDKRDGGQKKIAQLPALEFIDSFLQHVLPRGKRHVRNYGYLSPGKRVESLQRLAKLFDLNAKEEDAEVVKGGEPQPRERRAARAALSLLRSRSDGFGPEISPPLGPPDHADVARPATATNAALHVTEQRDDTQNHPPRWLPTPTRAEGPRATQNPASKQLPDALSVAV